MSIEIPYLISLISVISGVVGVWYGISRNRKHDLKQDASITFELKAVQTSLVEFKTEIKLLIDTNGKMTLENHDKIIKLETDMKTAFRRIDELREEIRR